MNDLTILYYTANTIPEKMAHRIRRHLHGIAHPFGIPIISVSQKPISLGRNICLGGIGVGIYNIYVQILEAAKSADTEYVACCEDDCLYNIHHFKHRPANDTFAYNTNKWFVNPKFFFHRPRCGMCMCVVSRQLLIDTLEERFRMYPTKESADDHLHKWGEPGRKEKMSGLPEVKLERYATDLPTLVINHKGGVGGRRGVGRNDQTMEILGPWGPADTLWGYFHG